MFEEMNLMEIVISSLLEGNTTKLDDGQEVVIKSVELVGRTPHYFIYYDDPLDNNTEKKLYRGLFEDYEWKFDNLNVTAAITAPDYTNTNIKKDKGKKRKKD